jgi:hypothetical protein
MSPGDIPRPQKAPVAPRVPSNYDKKSIEQLYAFMFVDICLQEIENPLTIRVLDPAYGKPKRMDGAPVTIRKYTDFDEIKADEYRYWQSRPAHERLEAVDEMIETAYAFKGWKIEPDAPRLQRPFVRLPVPWR